MAELASGVPPALARDFVESSRVHDELDRTYERLAFFEERVASVAEPQNGGQSHHEVDSLFNLILVHRSSEKHLAAALRVSHVSDFVDSGHLSHLVDLSGQVIGTQVPEVVGKELS